MDKVEKLDFEPQKKGGCLKVFIVFIIIILIVIFGIYFYYNSEISKVKNSNKEIEFTIDSGTSVYGVGEKLKEKGLIDNVLIYKIYVKLNNINAYKAGTYKIKESYNLKDIINTLSGNSFKDGITITFKEGITIEKIASLIEENTSINKDEFLSRIKDESYLNKLIADYWFLTDEIKNSDIYYPLEGYLYADTYTFSKNTTIDDIVDIMLKQSDKILTKYKDSIEKSSYSVHEFITLASVIEKEGINKDDRKLISSVFYNRLKNNMSLGSDVTTYYAFKVDIGSSDLTNSQINTYNAYNTRGPNMMGKLPVGAICNFSETSLDAAINPKESTYLYFVADKQGKTHFANTYSEHQKIIKELKESGNWIEF